MTDYEKYIDDMIAEGFSRLEMIEMCMNEFASTHPSLEYEEWRNIIKKRMSSNGGAEDSAPQSQIDMTPVNIPEKYTKAVKKGNFLLRWDGNGNGPIERWNVGYFDAWVGKYLDFKERVKNINSDFSSSMIDEDVYHAVCDIEKQLDEWYERRQTSKAKAKIESSFSSLVKKPQITSSTFTDNHGASWNDYDDKQVAFFYKSGQNIKFIAERLGRSERAIYYRLEHLQLIKEEQNPYRQPINASTHVYSRGAKPLDRYSFMLKHMNRSYRNGHKAPHKVILMLAVMSLYKKPLQRRSNEFEFTEDLICAFNKYWKKYVTSSDWSMDALTSWNDMKSEPFWHVEDSNGHISASIDDDLRRLFIDSTSMVELRELLVKSLY